MDIKMTVKNKVLNSLKYYNMISGDAKIICAVSGGADSMALLWCMNLIKDEAGFKLEAAHFNHHLRGEEANRDAKFVEDFCYLHNIPFHLGGFNVESNGRGLEAAARDARYSFLNSLNGLIATAHTANDNAETVLMHIIRGSSLKGLGGITPVNGKIIRPMLDVTRKEVEEFLASCNIDHIEDSSNSSNDFFRNRVRHDIMPLIERENKNAVSNITRMTKYLRDDEDFLHNMSTMYRISVRELMLMDPSMRRRCIENILKDYGLKIDITSKHIDLVESLIFSDNPSGSVNLPNGIIIKRDYDKISKYEDISKYDIKDTEISKMHKTTIECASREYCIYCNLPTDTRYIDKNIFTVEPKGKVYVRARKQGDKIKTVNGTKSLKKIFIDKKIPADVRNQIPVICDDEGILGVYGVGINVDRIPKENSSNLVTIWIRAYAKKGK